MKPIGSTQVIQNSILHARVREANLSQVDEKLHDVAQELEASFLAEMLKHSGFGETQNGFDGGAGEEQFGSFLRQAYAKEISQTTSIGLAQHIYESLKDRQNESV